MGGLKTEIAEGIRMFKPQSLKEEISLACMKDEQMKRQRQFLRPTQVNRMPLSLPPATRATPNAPFRRLPWEEMQKRKAQGLCFNCNERFTAGHKCQGMQLLLLEGPTGFNEITYEEVTEEADVEEATREIDEPEITLHALTGWSAPRTMRVDAKVGVFNAVVLIDSGSTHNFVSTRMADRLRLPVVPTETFTVWVANGARLQCQGKFEKVQVLLQEIPFSLTLYSLPLADLDIVLGVQWLEMLGYVICNWRTLTMKFYWENLARQLQGFCDQPIQAASLKEISKEFRQGHSVYAICPQSTMQDTKGIQSLSMSQVLAKYPEIFDEPTQLPPKREIDHTISLKEGIEPVNVQPYRYAYFQKAKIEKKVQEMLNSGLIRPSTSPFSSLVLLVKKKDGSWRFCTDYRSLNVVTIKDRFPIPTVEDMLDELHGAAYFTKLDLRAGYHQVRVQPSDIHKTAFRTHNGHYEYLVMPFGLSNAPSTFQAIMNAIFRPHLRKFILVFFDDILIYSPTWEMHLHHVTQTLDILKQQQFYLKASKCAFGKQELEYLGHIVSHQGVKVDSNKIKAMVAWPQPTNISELRGFFGVDRILPQVCSELWSNCSGSYKSSQKGAI